RAATGRPRRQALGTEQDEQGREQQAQDEPAGEGPPRGAQISPSSAAVAVDREPSSPGRAGREAVWPEASGRRAGRGSAAAAEWPSPCGPGPEEPDCLSAPNLVSAEPGSLLRPAGAERAGSQRSESSSSRPRSSARASWLRALGSRSARPRSPL